MRGILLNWLCWFCLLSTITSPIYSVTPRQFVIAGATLAKALLPIKKSAAPVREGFFASCLNALSSRGATQPAAASSFLPSGLFQLLSLIPCLMSMVGSKASESNNYNIVIQSGGKPIRIKKSGDSFCLVEETADDSPAESKKNESKDTIKAESIDKKE